MRNMNTVLTLFAVAAAHSFVCVAAVGERERELHVDSSSGVPIHSWWTIEHAGNGKYTYYRLQTEHNGEATMTFDRWFEFAEFHPMQEAPMGFRQNQAASKVKSNFKLFEKEKKAWRFNRKSATARLHVLADWFEGWLGCVLNTRNAFQDLYKTFVQSDVVENLSREIGDLKVDFRTRLKDLQVANRIANAARDRSLADVAALRTMRSELHGGPSSQPEDPLGECTVCLEQPRQIVFNTCGHIATCQVCADALAPGNLCPICRVVFTAKIKFFISS